MSSVKNSIPLLKTVCVDLIHFEWELKLQELLGMSFKHRLVFPFFINESFNAVFVEVQIRDLVFNLALMIERENRFEMHFCYITLDSISSFLAMTAMVVSISMP